MSKNIKQDKYPIRTEILALSHAQRHSTICEYIHSSLKQSLADKYIDLAYDDDFAEYVENSDISSDEINLAKDTLFNGFKKDLNILFYYFEKTVGSITSLASIIEQNLIDLFSPPETGPITDSFFSDKYWPWENHQVGQPPCHDDITFVLSCPRSGSTIFRLILGAHSKLFSPTELHILPFESMGARGEEIDKNGFPWMRVGLAQTLMELNQTTRKEADRAARKMLEDDLPVIDVYRHLQSKIDGRVLIEKTPFYSCHPHWIHRAIEMFPNAKFIFLTRHPFGMINSFVKLRIKDLTHNSFGCYGENPWHLGEKWWYTGNKNVSDFVESLPKEKSLFLRYEDLIADTRSSMINVCDFLNVSFEERVLYPYAETSENMIKGVGDPNIMEHTQIDVSLADSWKKQKLPHSLSPQTVELATKLGYLFDV